MCEYGLLNLVSKCGSHERIHNYDLFTVTKTIFEVLMTKIDICLCREGQHDNRGHSRCFWNFPFFFGEFTQTILAFVFFMIMWSVRNFLEGI